ncbi:hypothetical protein WN51_03515 [Melipona quadrifasciata]|uniref:Uncharacterized protein n=1 Tax=Melipona quadrifasciata TaxID=166423 RepID=A0A0N1IT97_9HYME|nr:hypothetical protein WN51_03515 [Melipona quadrifasciata]
MRIDLAETAGAFSRMIEARERFRDRASFQKPARADVPRAYVQAFFVPTKQSAEGLGEESSDSLSGIWNSLASVGV